MAHATFNWQDPFLLESQLSDEERMLRDAAAPDTAHLQVLATEKSVPLLVDAGLPYQAVSLIGSSLDG